MAFEKVFECVGESGYYQLRIFHMICLVSIPVALHTMLPLFINAETEHHCATQSLENVNCSLWNLSEEECEIAKLNITLPQNDKATPLINETACRFRNILASEFNPYMNDSLNESFETVQCDTWIYDKSQYTLTVVQQFNLVCGDSSKVALSWSIYFVGVMVGAFLFGNLADIFGRKPTFFAGILLQLVSELIVAFSPSYWVFVFFRLLVGLADMGIYLVGFVLITEFVGVSKRVLAGSVFAIYWAIGYMVIALLAFLIRDWRHLTIVVTAFSALQLLMYPFIPESAQWLNARGRTDEAKVILKRIAESNNRELADSQLDAILKEDVDTKEKSTKKNFTELFRHPNLRKKTLVLYYGWFVNSCIYYGLSFGSSSLKMNDYLAAAMFGFIELPAYALSWFALWKLVGRRVLLCSCLIAGGIACFMNIWIPESEANIRAICSITGKFFISASFSIIYMFSAELFPTVVRSVGVGSCSTFARIGGMLAPQLLFFGKFWSQLPSVVYSFLAITSGFLCLLLPETRGVPLPQTIQDGANFTKQTRKSEGTKQNRDYVELQTSPPSVAV
ncbi:organic cation transporter protein-like [Anneissia japonica]|uniref:organic cation transporter protein-like n=1 Tax=Anneissia japonica TaxID=1529436 RepID=UPI0014254B5B|nr:organic cation transporter protein-like [Anneissia japonica]